MDNTKLWDAVCKTDPSHTKAFVKGGGFKGTAIKPIYLIHKATEQWGSMGDKWGAESVEHVISNNTIFIRARVWYPSEKAGARATVEHWGGDVLTKGEKQSPNDEAFKMAFTDAVGKCLSQLGFGADVHLGMFDDSKYLAGITAEFKKETAISRNKRYNLIKELIEKSDDPAATWHENITEIEEFKESLGSDYHQQLIDAGKKRKLEVQAKNDFSERK